MNLFIGCNGGLGRTYLKFFSNKEDLFLNKKDLDILNLKELVKIIDNYKVDNIVIFAAFTNLPKAEIDILKCFRVNSLSMINICEILNIYKIKLYYISTDYVFSNNYENIESQITNPINIYGLSKKIGEDIIKKKSNNFCIIRTSWLFNEFQNNFVSKMLEKLKKNERIFINNEFGCPTSCESLAKFINKIINKEEETKEILHYRNYPAVSRIDFTLRIISLFNKSNKFKYKNEIIEISKFDNVRRPLKSVLNCNYTFEKYNITKISWYEELKKII